MGILSHWVRSNAGVVLIVEAQVQPKDDGQGWGDGSVQASAILLEQTGNIESLFFETGKAQKSWEHSIV